MKKNTNIKQTYLLCRRFLRKQGAILWSAVPGRRAISILTASLASVAGCLVLIAASADWQIRRLDVNLIPVMEESSHVYDRNGKELCQFWKQKRTVVPLSNISKHLVNVILAMEDQGFYQHRGYDLSGIVRAGWANLCAGKIEQGGSTLTQQLAKNTFLNPSRSYWRKLQGLWLARKIEKRYSKPEILEFYVMLADAVNRGTGSGVRAAGFQQPVGGKTGTTNDYRDAWFIGFTPEVVTGVWIGYDQPREIARRAYGARLAVPLWTAFMKQVPGSNKSFPRPAGIVQQLICAETGFLATPDCDVVTEYFTQWNTPHELCSGHHLEDWEVSSTQPGQRFGGENRASQGVH